MFTVDLRSLLCHRRWLLVVAGAGTTRHQALRELSDRIAVTLRALCRRWTVVNGSVSLARWATGGPGRRGRARL